MQVYLWGQFEGGRTCVLQGTVVLSSFMILSCRLLSVEEKELLILEISTGLFPKPAGIVTGIALTLLFG